MSRPKLDELYRLFDPRAAIPAFEIVDQASVPEPYQPLLCHHHHMTVTVEKHYGCPVNVLVLDRKQVNNWYARKILLTLTTDQQVVQYGIMRIHLEMCSDAVRNEILAESMPLGRILIHHDVMRRIEPIAYLKLRADAEMMHLFGLPQPSDVWGRLAIIHCDGQPAVELLEVLAPIH